VGELGGVAKARCLEEASDYKVGRKIRVGELYRLKGRHGRRLCSDGRRPTGLYVLQTGRSRGGIDGGRMGMDMDIGGIERGCNGWN